jgi:septal ring factor EnvC (AmiA/AmiB activator)
VNIEREKFFQNNNKFHQKENTSTSNLNNNSTDYNHELLSNEIEELKKTVRLQSQQIKAIKEENSQLKQQIKEINSNLSNVNKEIISLKETNKSIDKKINIIINKLEEQQEISQYQYRTQKLGSLQTDLQNQQTPHSYNSPTKNYQTIRPIKNTASQYECESINLEKVAEIEAFNQEMDTEIHDQHRIIANPLYDDDTESLNSHINNYNNAETSYRSYNPVKYLPGLFKNN